MNKDEIDILNEAYAKIADFPERLKEAETLVTENFEFEQDYYNPLHSYNSTTLLRELRGKLITFVVRAITRGVNYEIDEREISEHINNTLGELGFDAQEIINYVDEHYESKADELSLKAIKDKVATLVPRIHGSNWQMRKPEMNDLVKKDTLILKCWLSWEYHFNYNEFIERMNAFEKYVAIELVDAKPSETEARYFNQAYSSYDDDGLGVRNIGGSFYQSVQIHKNGTLRVRFKPGYAERIGKAILRDFYKEGD